MNKLEEYSDILRRQRLAKCDLKSAERDLAKWRRDAGLSTYAEINWISFFSALLGILIGAYATRVYFLYFR